MCNHQFLKIQIILADKPEQFTITEEECKVINPGEIVIAIKLLSIAFPQCFHISEYVGSFSSDFSFMVYNVASRDVEASRVPE